MAKVQVITEEIVCDMSGVPLAEDEVEERKFKWEGKTYTLDLCASEASTFDGHMTTLQDAEKGIAEFVAAAKKKERSTASRSKKSAKASGPKTSKTSKANAHAQSLSQEIREWARLNGYPNLGARGRIPEEVTAEYNAAHKK